MDDEPNFVVLVRGGKWTYRKKKLEADCLVVVACSGLPTEFVKFYK